MSFNVINRPKMQLEIVKDPAVSGRRLCVNILGRKNFTETQTKRHQSAMELLELVVNSKEFKDKVTAIRSFTSSTSNGKKVYDKIMTGEEKLQPGHDYEIDLQVTMYEENNSTVGYTYSNVIGTWVNNKFFKQYSLGEIAGNTMHEWLHKLGYGHTSQSTPQRPNSVPYRIGYLMRDMVDAYTKGTLKLTDLYPVDDRGDVPEIKPIPEPVPPIEVKKKRVCARTWRTLWLAKTCWYE